MLLRVGIIVAVLLCDVSQTYSQNPGCLLIDFNELGSILEFEQCEDIPVFSLKSYDEVPIGQFRSHVQYHLSNVGVIDQLCARTKQHFNLDTYSEVDTVIYLNSNQSVYFEILAFDEVQPEGHLVGQFFSSSVWNMFTGKIHRNFQKATIEIRAYVTADTLLAVEYLHIMNPTKAEMDCRRIITTTTTTTMMTQPEPTETDTTQTVIFPTETPPPKCNECWGCVVKNCYNYC